jgi:hypothetical protein
MSESTTTATEAKVEEPKAKAPRTTSKAQAAKPKGPEVEIKSTKPKAQPKPKPKLDEATAKKLRELSKEISRLEGLKNDRLALIRKAHEAKAPISEIAEAAGLSVPRTRQLFSK